MEKKEPHISVFPKLKPSIRNTNPTQFDPDVEAILNPKMQKIDNIDILKMPHEPTEEEQNNSESKQKDSQWPWLIIILAFIIVVLVIFIVWYVLKTNDESTPPPNIPRSVIHPNIPQHNQFYNNQMPVHPVHNYMHPLQPNNRPQTENLPIQTKSISKKQPTKKELMQTLNKMTLKPIIEDENKSDDKKILKPSKSQNFLAGKSQTTEQENDGVDDEDIQDSELASKFYQNLQQNIDNDDVDDKSDDGK